MENQKYTEENNINSLVEDARALVAATADVAGDKVAEARKRLATALDTGKELISRAREKAVDQAKAADVVIRNNPYQTMVIALGIGALIGYLAAQNCKREA